MVHIRQMKNIATETTQETNTVVAEDTTMTTDTTLDTEAIRDIESIASQEREVTVVAQVVIKKIMKNLNLPHHQIRREAAPQEAVDLVDQVEETKNDHLPKIHNQSRKKNHLPSRNGRLLAAPVEALLEAVHHQEQKTANQILNRQVAVHIVVHLLPPRNTLVAAEIAETEKAPRIDLIKRRAAHQQAAEKSHHLHDQAHHPSLLHHQTQVQKKKEI